MSPHREQPRDLPIPAIALRDLFQHLNTISGTGYQCDHQFTLTTRFLTERTLPVPGTLAWLGENGAGCDCEVIFNVEQRWGEAVGYHPPDEDDAEPVTDSEVEVQHKGIRVTIADPASIDGGKPTPDAVRRYEAIVDRLDDIRRFAASKLLPLYNESWRDEDHSELDATVFVQRLSSPSLTVYEEGMTLVYFDDGDMFGGHSIEVTTQDGEPTDVEIVG